MQDRSTWRVPTFEKTFWTGAASTTCVIIPVINEGARIRSLVERMFAIGIPSQADVIIVDGGSTDGSLEPAWLEARGVRSLIVKRGPGKLGAQLRCAYAFALDQHYHNLITIDGNDKDDPDAIPAFIQALSQGVDFVQGSRYLPGGVAENTPWIRDLAIRLVHAPVLSLTSGFKWTDTTQGFRGYSRALLLDDRVAPFRDVFETYELLAYLSYKAPRLGYRCQELPTTRRYPLGEVPTKISGVQGNLGVLKVLMKACSGAYDPPRGRP